MTRTWPSLTGHKVSFRSPLLRGFDAEPPTMSATVVNETRTHLLLVPDELLLSSCGCPIQPWIRREDCEDTGLAS